MQNEILVKYARAYPKTCIGPQRHKRDIMLSFTLEDPPSDNPHFVLDCFLTKDSAEYLCKELKEALERNEQTEASTEP